MKLIWQNCIASIGKREIKPHRAIVKYSQHLAKQNPNIYFNLCVSKFAILCI